MSRIRPEKPDPKSAASRILGVELLWSVLFFGVVVVLLGTNRCGGTDRFQVGEVAPHDVVARPDVEVPDPTLTQARREEARASIPDVYVHDRERASRLVDEFAAEARSRLDAPPEALARAIEAMGKIAERPVVGSKALLE